MSGEEPVRSKHGFEPVELQLFRLSPLGYWPTVLACFLLSFGSAVLIAALTQRPPLFDIAADGTRTLEDVIWISLVLSLILTTGLALSEGGRRLWVTIGPQFQAALNAEGQAAFSLAPDRVDLKWRGRYRLFALIGFVIGCSLNGVIILSDDIPLPVYLTSIGLWFAIFSGPLYAMGLRAGLDVVREGSSIKRCIRDYVEVDLFHLDRLQVFGTIGLRGAISWLLMAGILLLFIADPAQAWIALIAVFLAMCGGFWIFTSAVRPIHDKIRAAKEKELADIHARMATLRDAALAGDTAAAGALAGLTDYEIWIQQRPEWPLSPTVTLRFALYVLIPVVPIAGAYLFEKIADQIFLGG